MVKIFLCTHGHMASGMASSIEILTGNKDALTYFDAYIPGNTDTVAKHIDAFYESCSPEDTKLLISDMVGGSVCQETMKYLDRENTFVISGVNLSLLLELTGSGAVSYTKEELQSIIEMSRSMTKLMELDHVVIDTESFF